MSYYVRTIILFLIIPSECSLPTNMLTNIAIKSPIYIIYSLINASNVTVAVVDEAYLNNIQHSFHNNVQTI